MRRRIAIPVLLSLLFRATTFAATSDERKQVGPQVIYSPVGKRDPFRPPALLGKGGRELTAINPLERFAVEQFQLKAILRGLGAARAMFEAPDQKTYIVREGDRFGRERATVSKILDSEVIVTERTFNYLGEESLYEKILSLPPDEEGGIESSASKKASGAVAAPAQQGTAPAAIMQQMGR